MSHVSLRGLGDELWGGKDRPQGTGEEHRPSRGRQSRTAFIWHPLPSPAALSPQNHVAALPHVQVEQNKME